MYDSHSSLSTVGRWALESKIDFPSRADFVAASRKGNSSLAPASARTTLTLGSAYATWFPVSLPTRQFPYAVTRLFIPPLGESAFSNYVRMARRYSYEESARYRDFRGWKMPWYSARDSLNTLLAGRRVGRLHIVCYLRQGFCVFET